MVVLTILSQTELQSLLRVGLLAMRRNAHPSEIAGPPFPIRWIQWISGRCRDWLAFDVQLPFPNLLPFPNIRKPATPSRVPLQWCLFYWSGVNSVRRGQMTTSRLAVWVNRTAAGVRRWAVCPSIPCLAAALWITFIPGLASGQSAGGQGGASGALQGTVNDTSGSTVAVVIVTLEGSASTGQRTAITDQAGGFRFFEVEPGNYKITIAAAGFAVWTEANVAAGSGDRQPLLSAVLQVATTTSSVNVTLLQHELAAEQLKDEEKQRLLGVFPNFFVTYAPDAAPLTAAQKFQLGWKTITDPVAFLGTGVAAGLQQARDNYSEFGQGVEGYAKRFGAQYANRVDEVLIGHVAMQSIFHQDPRYFYKGTGSFGSRVLYAIGTAFVRKGDNGHWQPDYSDVLGGLASSEISTLYYPSSSRPVRRVGGGGPPWFGGRGG